MKRNSFILPLFRDLYIFVTIIIISNTEISSLGLQILNSKLHSQILYYCFYYISFFLFFFISLIYLTLYIYTLTYYRSLCEYINCNRYSFQTAMYVSALYEGLDIALEPYRKTIVDLEVDILKQAGTQLSLLQHRLIPHRPILRALVQLVNEIQEEDPIGCMILDKVYKASASGVEGVGRALKQAGVYIVPYNMIFFPIPIFF